MRLPVHKQLMFVDKQSGTVFSYGCTHWRNRRVTLGHGREADAHAAWDAPSPHEGS